MPPTWLPRWHGHGLASEAYELDKPIGRRFADLQYYTHLLADISGPILEPAAGAGRILIPLFQAGHQMCRLQHWSSQEFGQLLAETGFTGIYVTADYQGVRAPTPSTMWTFHATATRSG